MPPHGTLTLGVPFQGYLPNFDLGDPSRQLPETTFTKGGGSEAEACEKKKFENENILWSVF